MAHDRKMFVALALALAGSCGRSPSSERPRDGAANDAAPDDANGGGGGRPASGGVSGGSGGANSGSGGRTGGSGGGAGGAGGTRACPDYTPRGLFLCRTADDCPGPVRICSPNPSTGCGFRPDPMRQCGTDTDCAGGLCVQGTMQPCATQPDTFCIPRCTETSCAAGARCNSTGRCELVPCTDGFTCPTGLHCQAGSPGTDGHGCVLDDCATGGWICPQDQRCQLPGDAHGCRCASDKACPINQRCNLTATGGFGCALKACTVDTDCDCGVCIGQQCQLGLWACQMAVP